jgi:ubiquinone/menaquinone biosynthesis C-methylase UbiE
LTQELIVGNLKHLVKFEGYHMEKKSNKAISIPVEKNGFVETLNGMGYMTSKVDPISQEFINFCERGKSVLEIGAAYGVATLQAVQKGCSVVANDIDNRHLEILLDRAPQRYKQNITLKPGRFPEGIFFDDNTFDAILICRVLHFFSGREIELAIKKATNWLKPGGRIYVVAETPYLKNWKSFIPEYEDRKNKGAKWPGYIEQPSLYEKNRTANLPSSVHWLDEHVLKRTFDMFKLKTIKSGTLNRTDFPDDLKLDGRESVGIIGEKRWLKGN